MRPFRALAYQYIDLDDASLPGKELADFKKFLQDLGFGDLTDLNDAKGTTFSYPDLYSHAVAASAKDRLKSGFAAQATLCTLDDIYAVYVRRPAPQIGFSVSMAMELSFLTLDIESLKKYLSSDQDRKSPFHLELNEIWKNWIGRRRTLPVVLFCPEDADSEMPWMDQGIFSTPICAQLPSCRPVSIERGFPSVSYVIHARLDAAVPEDIHRRDFALLAALPGFIEGQMESVTQYRKDLNEVLSLLKEEKNAKVPDLKLTRSETIKLLAAKTRRGVQHFLGKYPEPSLHENDNFSKAQDLVIAAWRKFEKIQRLAPITVAAAQRIIQKYPEPSLYAVIANDNIKLIEATVAAGITATEQVRSNLQTFAQQRLQQSTNTLQESMNRVQSRYTSATIVLVIIAVLQVFIAFRPTITRLDRPLAIQEPLRIFQEPQLRVSGLPTLRVAPLYEPIQTPTKAINLVFSARVTEMTADVNIPDAGTNPPTRVALIKDGILVAEGTIISRRPIQGVRVYFPKDLVLSGRLLLEITQENNTLRIAIRARSAN